MKSIEQSAFRITVASTVAGIIIFAPLRFMEVWGFLWQGV